MFSDPRSIFFQTELRFLPIEELSFDKSFARKLYHQLAGPGGYPYEDLLLREQPFTMSSKRTTVVRTGSSSCEISPHSILVEECEPEVNHEGFIEIVDTILQAALEVGGDYPPVFGQRSVIRCLSKPTVLKNSIDFLAGKVSRVLDVIEPFGRPPAFFGIRFRFPPVEISDPEAGDDEEPVVREDFVSLRFETWAQDIEQVWMEITSMKMFQEPVDISENEKFGESFREVYDFLTKKGVSFLNQFDVADEGEES